MIGGWWPFFWRIAGAVGVRSKIMGIVGGVILLVGTLVIVNMLRDLPVELRHQSEAKGVAIARSLATRGADPVLTGGTYSLYSLAQETRASDDDIVYVYVTDPDGRPLVHTFGEGFPRGLLSLASPAPGERYRAVRLSTSEGRIQDISVPILDGRGGTVHVGMSEARIEAVIAEELRQNVVIVLIVLAIGLAAAYVLATILTRPVSRIVSATEAVGQGDFTLRAPIWAADQIGQLGKAFNRMTEQLAASNEQLLRQNRELAALNETASAISQSRHVKEVHTRSLENVLRVLGLETGWILILDADGGGLRLAHSQGMPEPWVHGDLHPAADECVCAQALDAREPTRLDLRDGCPWLAAGAQESLASTSIIAVPLRAKGRPQGLLTLVLGERDLSAEDLRLLGAIGDQVGVALENALLWEELRRKEEVRGGLLESVITAQEQERLRISRELHDATGQALTSLMVQLRALGEAPDLGTATRMARDLRGLVSSTLDGVRALSADLRPSVLDDLGLVPAIRRYTATFAERNPVRVDLHTQGLDDLRLDSPVETALYRIVQEALNNVARHAEAGSVNLLLERRNSTLVLVIEDDGRGFDVEGTFHGGAPEYSLGLHGMEERTILIGGRFTVESAPGQGTTLFVQAPINGKTVGDRA